MVKYMDTGKVTLSSAITAAEAASKGKATAAACTLTNGKLGFDVHCVSGDKVSYVEVDGAGKAGKSTDAGGDVSKTKDAAKAIDKVTLASAIGAAETASKGKAVAAGAKSTAGKVSFEVFCLAGDKIMKVDVDDAGQAGKTEEAKAIPECKHEAKAAPKGG
jgi:uncharacterized membrane protein YkoI